MIRLLPLVVLLLACTSALHAQAVQGRLLDRATAEPVAAATLTLQDLDGRTRGSAATDSAGDFRFARVRPGPYRLHVARIGYAATTTEWFEVSTRETVTLELRLAVAPVPVLPVTVTARSVAPRVPLLESRGFYERRRAFSGSFVTRDQIEKRQPRETVELFRTLRGFRVMPNPRGYGYVLVARRGGPRTCFPHVYLDGVPLKTAAGDWMDAIYSISPEHIEAIEAYAGPATIPAHYNALGAACAAVLVWTRDGSR